MAEFSDLKDFVSSDPQMVQTMLSSDRTNIANKYQVKILLSRYLTPFWEERTIKYDFVICIKERLIDHIDFDVVQNALKTTIKENLKMYCFIEINEKCAVINRNPYSLNEQLLKENSLNGKIVFFFGEKGIDIAIRGELIERINFFYDESDRARFKELYHISDLKNCMVDYGIFINQPGINQAFFANNIVISKISEAKGKKNILVNRPESVLRDNLLVFLNTYTQHDFTKEIELNNRRELDLYTEVDGKKYLIEVKWLGQSIDALGTKLTSKFTDVDARNGIVQTLEYIEELHLKMNYKVHCGFLCVFDVREKKKTINYREYKFIPEILKNYYKDHFIKIDEIILDNIST